MKIQLKYILPFSVQTSPDFEFSSETTLPLLKKQISEIFNVPLDLLFLKIVRDSYFVAWPFFSL